MKKILFWIFSAVLAVSVSIPASAGAPQARKAGGAESQVLMQASEKPALNKRQHTATTRKAFSADNALRFARGTAALRTSSPQRIAAENVQLPNLQGSVTFNDTFNQATDAGLFKVGNGFTELIFAGPSASYGGVFYDGLYYCFQFVNYGFFQLNIIDVYDLETKTKLHQLSGSPDTLFPFGITVDPTTGDVYGISYTADGAGKQFGKVTLSGDAVSTQKIADIEGNWNSLACDANGQLYAISYTGTMQGEDFVVNASYLNKIDKETGAVTLVGETGMLPQYLSSATIDSKTNKMYWNVCAPDESGILAEVNLTTGQATKICDLEYNDEIMGMFVAQPEAENNAPASVTALALNFPNGSLSGTVSFNAPTTLFDGTPASGALSYEILVNDVPQTGNTTFGATENVAVTVPQAGSYTFTVTVSNANGKSPKAKATTFIGNGVPEAPTATLAYENGNMNLSWTAVSTTADGGYIDPAAVTYTVTRFPGEVVVAENVSVTAFSEAINAPAELTQYYYTVVASSAGLNSAAAQSNVITLGSIVPPYTNTFDTAASLDGFTILDGNGDGKMWQWYQQAVRISYNSSLNMDDWLMTPPMALEGGKAYLVKFDAAGNGSSFPERLEVKYGTEPTAAGMTGVLLEPTVIQTGSGDWKSFEAYLVAPANGVYYIGFHGISDADQFYLWLDNISVGAPTATTAPGKVTDIVITPDFNGELKANVAFKAPSVDFAGNALSGNLTKVEVSRLGTVAKTFENVSAGAALSFDDVLTEGGNVTYTFQAYNATGAGMNQDATVFIGPKKPAAPTGITLVETATEGQVTLSWQQVTTDADGQPLNPALVDYIVCEPDNATGQWIPMYTTKELSYTFQAVPAGQQDFVQFAVFAQTAGGNTGAVSPMIPVGTPFDGLNESFSNGTLTYPIATGYTEGGAWSIVDDSKFSDLASADGDNGFLLMQGQYLNDKSSLIFGKISLANAVNPGLSFYTFNIGDGESEENKDINEIAVYVKEPADAEWTLLNNIVISDLSDEIGWIMATHSLQAYAGKVIELRLEGVIKKYANIMVDAIKVGSMLGNDLVARSISVPSTVKAGEDYTVDVTVGNNGTQDAAAFTVELYADQEKVDAKTVEGLASGKNAVVSFDRTMSAVAETPVVYYATVVYTADENPNNNTTQEATATPKFSSLPVVENLKGEAVAEGVKLTWAEPNLDGGVAETVTEDFENADSWAQEMDGWTFIDQDDSAVGGFQGSDIPGITVGESKVAFFVFDQEAGGFNQTFNGHSGHKYLASLFRIDGGQVSDWAISPVLSGNAQTVSFYAKSYSGDYPESIEVLYSNGGLTPADFIKVKDLSPVPGEWTLVEANLPAGASYFAIHSTATDAFMLMIDDVTYERGSSTANLSIVGYDIYRDGVKLNTEPVGECEYVDATAEGEHTYAVVAVYNNGISAPATVTVSNSGVAGITAGVRIAAVDHNIVVTGAEGKNLVINSVDGRTVFAGIADAQTKVAVATGIYLVQVDNTVAKIIVK